MQNHSPGDNGSHLSRGIHLISEHKFAEAIAVLQYETSDVWCVFHLGMAQAYASKLDDAFVTFEKVCSMNWKDMFFENNPYFYLGGIQLLRGLYSPALAFFDMAKNELLIEDLFQDVRLFHWSGIAYLLQNQKHKAIPELCAAIVLQQSASVPTPVSSDHLVLMACVKNIELDREDFEVAPFHLDLKPEKYEILERELNKTGGLRGSFDNLRAS